MEKEYNILKQICDARKSYRKFSDKEVSDADISRILDIAKTSPYASGQAKWEILVIKDKDILRRMTENITLKVAEISSLMRDDLKEYFVNYSKSFEFFQEAPVTLVLTFRVSPVFSSMLGQDCPEELKQYDRDNFTKSISCVAMLISLAAESLGLASCYMTGPIIAQDLILPIIGAKPGREIGAIIPIGHKINT